MTPASEGPGGSTIEGNAADIELRVIAISAPRRFQVVLETNDTRTVDKNLSVVAEWEEAESDNIIKLEKIGAEGSTVIEAQLVTTRRPSKKA